MRLTWGFGSSAVLLALPGHREPWAAVTACTRPFCARIVPTRQGIAVHPRPPAFLLSERRDRPNFREAPATGDVRGISDPRQALGASGRPSAVESTRVAGPSTRPNAGDLSARAPDPDAPYGIGMRR
jgi:hypothetical protein